MLLVRRIWFANRHNAARVCNALTLVGYCAVFNFVCSAGDAVLRAEEARSKWKTVAASYTQYIDSIPALRCSKSEAVLANRSRSGIGEVPREHLATVWEDADRWAIRQDVLFSKSSVSQWMSAENGRYILLGLPETDNPGPQVVTMSIRNDVPGRGRLYSQWTIRRVLGERLGCWEISLRDLFSSDPQEVCFEELNGVDCLKAEFLLSQNALAAGGRISSVVVWLESGPVPIPRRIVVAREEGDSTVTEIQATETVDCGSIGSLSLPSVATVDLPLRKSEIRFGSFQAFDDLPDAVFIPPAEFGTQVIDSTGGSRKVSYVGGDEGERRFLERIRAPENFIRAKLDQDPKAIEQLLLDAVVAEAVGTQEESSNRFLSPVSILLGVSLVIVCAATLRKRAARANQLAR